MVRAGEQPGDQGGGWLAQRRENKGGHGAVVVYMHTDIEHTQIHTHRNQHTQKLVCTQPTPRLLQALIHVHTHAPGAPQPAHRLWALLVTELAPVEALAHNGILRAAHGL